MRGSKYFGRINSNGNVDVLHTDDETRATTLDENVCPVGSNVSARYDHPQGIIFSLADAKKIGLMIE